MPPDKADLLTLPWSAAFPALRQRAGDHPLTYLDSAATTLRPQVDFEHAALEHGALKFQAGTPDVAGPVGLAAAVTFIEASGRDALWKHDEELVRHGLARLGEIPRLRLISPKTAANRIPVFTFVMAGQTPAALATLLDQQGIAIRAGDLAALPVLRRFGTATAARASAYVYSTRADLDRLADALAAIR